VSRTGTRALVENAWTEHRLKQYLKYYPYLVGYTVPIASSREFNEGWWRLPEKAKVGTGGQSRMQVSREGETGGYHHPRGRRRILWYAGEGYNPQPTIIPLWSMPWERLLVEKIDIDRAFDTLRGRQRDVIGARFIAGQMTQEQVAEVLGISQPTVWEHEQAGIQNMLRALNLPPLDLVSGLPPIVRAQLARAAARRPDPLPESPEKERAEPYNSPDPPATIKWEGEGKPDPGFEQLLSGHEPIIYKQAWRAVYLTFHSLDFEQVVAEIMRVLHLPGVKRWLKKATNLRAAIWWQARRAANREIDRCIKRERRFSPGASGANID